MRTSLSRTSSDHHDQGDKSEGEKNPGNQHVLCMRETRYQEMMMMILILVKKKWGWKTREDKRKERENKSHEIKIRFVRVSCSNLSLRSIIISYHPHIRSIKSVGTNGRKDLGGGGKKDLYRKESQQPMIVTFTTTTACTSEEEEAAAAPDVEAAAEVA